MPYLVRQLRDYKGGIEESDLQGNGLLQYAEVCGELLAKGHARSGDPCMLTGYLGTSDRFDKALVNFAVDYADQTTRDFEAWLKAIKAGTVEVLKPVAEKVKEKKKKKGRRKERRRRRLQLKPSTKPKGRRSRKRAHRQRRSRFLRAKSGSVGFVA